MSEGITQQDRQEMYDTMCRYVWRIDQCDKEGVIATFTKDAVVQDFRGTVFDAANGGARGFGDRHIPQPRGTRTGQHWFQPIAFESVGGGARMTSYWSGVKIAADGNPPALTSLGMYRDTFVKENGKWLMKEKIISPWHNESAPVGHQPLHRVHAAATSMPGAGLSAEDRYEMIDNLNMYTWSLDRGDGPGATGVFTRDGVLAMYNGDVFEGREALSKRFDPANRPTFRGVQHHAQPLIIEPFEDGYVMYSYWRATRWPAGEQPRLASIGHYRHVFVKEDGKWRFKRQEVNRWDNETPPTVDVGRDA
jgi:hypothetical protein